MTSKFIRFFNGSLGGLFAAMAVALFLGSRTDAEIILPHDPVFALSIRYLLWITSGICLVMALVNLSGKPNFLRSILMVGVTTTFVAYRLGCMKSGAHGLGGYLGSFADAFGVSAATAGTMAEVTLAYLFFGSYFVLIALLWQKRQNVTDVSLKMTCPACGTHIKFAGQNLGQKIPCPHCQKETTLRENENLKMSCFFCKEHIEFPAHSIGEKISCPHCKMDITLKEPA